MIDDDSRQPADVAAKPLPDPRPEAGAAAEPLPQPDQAAREAIERATAAVGQDDEAA